MTDPSAPNEPSNTPEPSGWPRLTRRALIAASAAGAGLVAGGGFGLWRLLGDGEEADFVLRPGPTTVELGRRRAVTWAYNGALPTHELRVKQGQRVRIRVENGLPEETTIHWHGVRLHNPMDGVPGLTQPPIKPGDSFLYDFTPPDAGTFFFHPHVGTQLDRGLYGALIVDARNESLEYDREATLVLDDWLDGIDGRTPPKQIAELRKNGMGMGGMSGMDMGGMSGMKQPGGSSAMRHLDLNGSAPAAGTLPGLATALEAGKADAGDVAYPLHLVNGRPTTDPFRVEVKRGERLRLRLVNAASDTIYCFYVQGHPLTLVASDGQEIEPRTTDGVVLGMGERADVLLEATTPGAFRMVAVALGKQAQAHAILRYTDAPRSSVPAASDEHPPMRIASSGDLRDLRAPEPLNAPREIRIDLDMDMSAPYRWSIGGAAFANADRIHLARDEHIRFVLRNLSTMPHPMHLHGHFFRVATSAGDGARKDTILVPPKASLKLDLVADNPGKWMFHCHNVYHQVAGMMRAVDVAT